ncbi:DUF3102 domain-containing protein [Bacillus sp. ISL-75]|uniref:DUF3102 domain-containing protein n=1 Tax=Bacillus sp. ISL-75 TaxID=2819137 RepID=UPI001BE83FCA|nr:DUF3102 domain-containing protein [Bacillus sp. ISL-75]MBT2728371.1 DUF3102 domain-containing protein [Bacillus sp. ISL-75]
MNELAVLSEDLKIHGIKIRMSKNRIGQEIIEIGRELAEAKEKCKHGEWLSFLKQECEISDSSAQEYIQVYKEFGNTRLGGDLGKKALLFLTRLPEEQKEQPHEISTGTKTIYEMNQEEVRELQKQIKKIKEEKHEAEKRAAQAERSEQIALKNLEKVENMPVKEIVKEVEVIPDYLKNSLEEKDKFLKVLKKESEQLQEEIKALKLQQKEDDSEKENSEKMLKKLEREANIETLQIVLDIQRFIKDSSLSSFQVGAIVHSNEHIKEKIKESVKMLENFIKNLNNAVNGRKQI